MTTLVPLFLSEKSMNNVVTSLAPSFSIGPIIFFILAGNKETHNISHGFEIRQDPSRDL